MQKQPLAVGCNYKSKVHITSKLTRPARHKVDAAERPGSSVGVNAVVFRMVTSGGAVIAITKPMASALASMLVFKVVAFIVATWISAPLIVQSTLTVDSLVKRLAPATSAPST